MCSLPRISRKLYHLGKNLYHFAKMGKFPVPLVKFLYLNANFLYRDQITCTTACDAVVQIFCFKVQEAVAMGDVGGAAAAGAGDAEPFLHGTKKRKGGIAWTPWPEHAGFRVEVRYPHNQGPQRNRINVAASRRATCDKKRYTMSHIVK